MNEKEMKELTEAVAMVSRDMVYLKPLISEYKFGVNEKNDLIFLASLRAVCSMGELVKIIFETAKKTNSEEASSSSVSFEELMKGMKFD